MVNNTAFLRAANKLLTCTRSTIFTNRTFHHKHLTQYSRQSSQNSVRWWSQYKDIRTSSSQHRNLWKSIRQYYNGGSFYTRHQNNTNIIVYTIIGVNAVIFLSWNYALSTRDYKKQKFMSDHFTVSWNNIMEGRLHTLITAGYSHYSLGHFLINMFVLSSFGPTVIFLISFLYFYISISFFFSYLILFKIYWILSLPLSRIPMS